MIAFFSFFFSNIISITFVTLFIFAALIIFTSFNPSTIPNSPPSKKQIGKVVTIETFGSCNQYKSTPDKLDKECKTLDKNSCNAVSCCVFLNGKECIAGDKHGPTYLGTEDNPTPIEYYYHKNTCYPGSGICPT